MYPGKGKIRTVLNVAISAQKMKCSLIICPQIKANPNVSVYYAIREESRGIAFGGRMEVVEGEEGAEVDADGEKKEEKPEASDGKGS